MKITAIKGVGLRGQTPKGGWANEVAPEDSLHTLVAIHTDAGVVGHGSVFSDERLVRAALLVLEPLLLGENPLEPERVTEKLAQHTFWLGMGGTLTHTQSGIDIALWDILGKVTGQPVGRLLGGRYRDRVKAYCSVLMDEPAKMKETLARYAAKGFRAFKIGWGPFGRKNARVDEAIVSSARDAIGPECELMVDAGASDAFWPHGYKWALRTATMLEDYDVSWFEEPLNPDAVADYAQLRAVSHVPIAGGEVLTRRQSFRVWMERRALDIVQPDVTKVGGLSEQRRIAHMAEDFGIQYVGHGWNTALGLACDLQLASALPQVRFVEYIGGSAYVDNIASPKFVLDAEGYLHIPASPGLGLSLDRDMLSAYTNEPQLLFD